MHSAAHVEEADVNELGAVEAVLVGLVHNHQLKVDAVPPQECVHERNEVHELGGGVAEGDNHLRGMNCGAGWTRKRRACACQAVRQCCVE